MGAPAQIDTAEVIAPHTEAELARVLREHHAAARPVRISGGGTRVPLAGGADLLTTRHISGIVTYSPGELTLVAKAGTPMDEIEAALKAEGQALAFEPMDHRTVLGSAGTPTIGGVVAANVSGPRLVLAGACRDHLLGVRFVDGQGRVIRNGGRVMKNVTGMDLGKLLCGSYGTLGVLTEIALKTLPAPPGVETLALRGLSAREAVAVFSAALGTPFEVSGAAWLDRTAWLRIEGRGAQLDYRRERLLALLQAREPARLDAEESRDLWRGLRDLHHLSGAKGALWRIALKPTDAPAVIAALEALGGVCAMDWGGALIWYVGSGDPLAVRRAAGLGSATLLRAPDDAAPSFPPERGGAALMSRALRRVFDPAGILNPGLMGG
ncbi:MAG: FAD-binding protein [Paracoccus sp. (in: a-proteobacteria)]|nr:FAD-binding protein [Paracoccus sp. (in: a-proteobacteria)]